MTFNPLSHHPSCRLAAGGSFCSFMERVWDSVKVFLYELEALLFQVLIFDECVKKWIRASGLAAGGSFCSFMERVWDSVKVFLYELEALLFQVLIFDECVKKWIRASGAALPCTGRQVGFPLSGFPVPFEGEPRIFESIRPVDPGFCSIDDQFQFLLKKAAERFHHSICRRLLSDPLLPEGPLP